MAVLAAIAIPAYRDYTVRAEVSLSEHVREAVGDYYESRDEIPESLESLGLPTTLDDGTELWLDPEKMVLTVTIERGNIYFLPSLDPEGRVLWRCVSGEGLTAAQMPASCGDVGY